MFFYSYPHHPPIFQHNFNNLKDFPSVGVEFPYPYPTSTIPTP